MYGARSGSSRHRSDSSGGTRRSTPLYARLLAESVEDDLLARHGAELARRIARDRGAARVLDREALDAIRTWVSSGAGVDAARVALRDVLARLVEAMPRRSRQVARHVLGWYLKGSADDLSDLLVTLPGELRDFERLARRRLLPSADVTAYRTRDAFRRAVKDALAREAARPSARERRREVDEATEVVHEDHRWLVVHPLDIQSACHWGRGTRWCTASEERRKNAYWNYETRDGPLWIAVEKPTARRWALLLGAAEIRNAEDELIPPEDLPDALVEVLARIAGRDFLRRARRNWEAWEHEIEEPAFDDEDVPPGHLDAALEAAKAGDVTRLRAILDEAPRGTAGSLAGYIVRGYQGPRAGEALATLIDAADRREMLELRDALTPEDEFDEDLGVFADQLDPRMLAHIVTLLVRKRAQRLAAEMLPFYPDEPFLHEVVSHLPSDVRTVIARRLGL